MESTWPSLLCLICEPINIVPKKKQAYLRSSDSFRWQIQIRFDDKLIHFSLYLKQSLKDATHDRHVATAAWEKALYVIRVADRKGW